MAVSLIAKPDTISPAFNRMKFLFDSTNVNETGFRYVVDVYDVALATKIAEYKLLPNLDGYGEIDLSKLLQTKVSVTEPTDLDQYTGVNNYFKYDVKVGEMYVAKSNWTAILTDDGGYVEITPTAAHTYVVGDYINIIQADGGSANPALEGLFVVTAVNGTTSYTVNSLWADVTDANIDGYSIYSDNRKTITRDLYTTTNNYVLNCAINPYDWINWDSANYVLDGSTKQFLTSMPQTFKMTPNQDIWINAMTQANVTRFLYVATDTGIVIRKAITTNAYVVQIGIGNDFDGYTAIAGSLPIDLTTVDYYDYWFDTGVPGQISKKYRVYIDNRCTMNDYSIVFMDRMGSLGSFAFQLVAQLNVQIEREKYNQSVNGTVTSSEWKYDNLGRGVTNLNITPKEEYTLNSNWMTAEQEAYFKELVTSPYTWMKIGTEVTSYRSCVVLETSTEVESQGRTKLYRKTIKVQLSLQEVVNG